MQNKKFISFIFESHFFLKDSWWAAVGFKTHDFQESSDSYEGNTPCSTMSGHRCNHKLMVITKW